MAQLLGSENAVLVENEAVGHTTVSQTSACTKGIVSNYLLNSKVSPPWIVCLSCVSVLMEGFFCSCLRRIPNARRIRAISSRTMPPAPAGPSGASEGKGAVDVRTRARTSVHGCTKINSFVAKVHFCLLYRLFSNSIYSHPHTLRSFSLENTSHSFIYRRFRPQCTLSKPSSRSGYVGDCP